MSIKTLLASLTLSLALAGCASSGPTLSAPVDTLAVCGSYQTGNERVNRQLRSSLEEVIAQDERLYPCNRSVTAGAKLEVAFTDYKLSNRSERVAAVAVSAGSVALAISSGFPAVIIVPPKTSVTAHNILVHGDKGESDRFDLTEEKVSWFDDEDRQIDSLNELVRKMMERIRQAKVEKAVDRKQAL